MKRRRLLILGTGFAAVALLRRIDLRAYDVTLVSPRNHFLFTPLLPSTTVGTVEFRTVIEPIRLQRRGIRFLLAKAVHVDMQERVVRCQSVFDDATWDETFDASVLAVGCVPNTFGVSGVERHGFFLKEIEDARRIRERLVSNLERASLPSTSADEQARLLHVVAVGGGPTGVRSAGELYDLLRTDLPRTYPHLAGKARVTVVDSADSLLPAYDRNLREYVRREFASRGVVVRSATAVEEVTERGIYLPGLEFLPCGLTLWSAGFAPNPLVADLEVEKDRAGRIVTDHRLRIPGAGDVFAAGDCACTGETCLPQLSQVAEQQGRYLAASLNAASRGQELPAFRWRSWGQSSFIGGGEAVVDAEETGWRLSGYFAYQQWRAATWSQLGSVRSRTLVPLDRIRARMFGRDISKL
ncbi:MAG TPA: FAD-dependent oxidoreductase [Pirellulaceae bacterium]|nr:FAD-dependent oxidoreductase [Pirellulaceae bacterium]